MSANRGPQDETCDVAIVGAGPYGLSISAHLSAAGIGHRIFGRAMRMWEAGMPSGMILKSEGFATSLSEPAGRFTLAAYCAEQLLPYADEDWGIPVEVFTAYGRAFQERLVPHLESVDVTHVGRGPDGFDLSLADGRHVAARRVILATGLHPFPMIPKEFQGLPPELLSHSCDSADLRHLAGRRVAVIGGGASATDVAASLYRAGAEAILITRRSGFRFFPPRVRGLFDRLKAPRTPLGPGWKKLVCVKGPLLFRQLPAALRLAIVHRYLGPAPAYSVKETIEAHVNILTRSHIEGVARDGDTVVLNLKTPGGRQEIHADHVVAATGYRIDLARLGFVDPSLRAEIRCFGGPPILSADFETTAPGLFMVGTPSAATFGPLLRFVCGAGFAAQRLTSHLKAARPLDVARLAPKPATQPRIAFLSLTNDIGADRVVSAFGAAGAECAVLGRPDGYAMASRAAHHRIPLSREPLFARLGLLSRLERLVADWDPTRIAPLDDFAHAALRGLALGPRTSPQLRRLIVLSLGDPESYGVLANRYALLDRARQIGVRIPETAAVPDLASARTVAERLGWPFVLKRELTCGSSGVRLVHDADELPKVVRDGWWRAHAKRLTRMVLDPLGGESAAAAPGPTPILSAQSFIDGRVAMRTVVCRDGQVIDGINLVGEQLSSEPIGGFTIVAPIANTEMEQTAAKLVADLRLSGFVSFDFVVDAEDRAFLLECNPRSTGSTHLGARLGHDLVRAYLDGRRANSVEPAEPPSIALFPRELARDPLATRLRTESHLTHDVPTDEPAVLERYLAYLTRLHPRADLKSVLLRGAAETTKGARPGMRDAA